MRRVAAAAIIAGILLPAALAPADSFTPVRLTVKVAATAQLHRPVAVRVQVSADPGMLDLRDGPVSAKVKLATGPCGSTFEYTKGTTLLNRRLSPQPAPGRSYSGSARGSGRPGRRGVQQVCVFVQDRDARVFAADTTSYRVRVR